MRLSRLAERWRRFVWRRPEWWALAIAAAAWSLMAQSALTANEAHRHGAAGDTGRLSAPVIAWLLMVAAMMFPLVIRQVRGTALRSMWRRRHRAIGGFLLGYLSLWLIVGIPIMAWLWAWPDAVSPRSAAIAFFVAAAWQWAPISRRARRVCHREVPLAPAGWRADTDCLRYGWRVGCWCSITCWPVMIACALAQHGLVAMVAATILATTERPR
jgi:hypothetical protein